jgi:hypothetical protein
MKTKQNKTQKTIKIHQHGSHKKKPEGGPGTYEVKAVRNSTCSDLPDGTLITVSYHLSLTIKHSRNLYSCRI